MVRLKRKELVRMAVPDEPTFGPLISSSTMPSVRIELFAEALPDAGRQLPSTSRRTR